MHMGAAACVRKVIRSAKQLNGPELRWKVVVLNDPGNVNAFCAPGGTLVVHSGMLDFLRKNEKLLAKRGVSVPDALAVIICHEVGHAVARHSSEKLTWLPFFTFVALMQQSSPLLVSMVDFGLNLPMSRRMEREADLIGMELLAKSCFNIDAASVVFSVFGSELEGNSASAVAAEEGEGEVSVDSVVSALSEYASTHPLSSERAREAAKLAARIRPQWLTDCPQP
jgi:predicted Zn-dependent protease